MPIIMMRDLELIQEYLLTIHNCIIEAKEKKVLSAESFEKIEKNIEAINTTVRALRF